MHALRNVAAYIEQHSSNNAAKRSRLLSEIEVCNVSHRFEAGGHLHVGGQQLAQCRLLRAVLIGELECEQQRSQ